MSQDSEAGVDSCHREERSITLRNREECSKMFELNDHIVEEESNTVLSVIDMACLSILIESDCSGYTLDRLVSQRIHTKKNGAAVFCSIRRLISKGFVCSNKLPERNTHTYVITKAGRAYFEMISNMDGCDSNVS